MGGFETAQKAEAALRPQRRRDRAAERPARGSPAAWPRPRDQVASTRWARRRRKPWGPTSACGGETGGPPLPQSLLSPPQERGVPPHTGLPGPGSGAGERSPPATCGHENPQRPAGCDERSPGVPSSYRAAESLPGRARSERSRAGRHQGQARWPRPCASGRGLEGRPSEVQAEAVVPSLSPPPSQPTDTGAINW